MSTIKKSPSSNNSNPTVMIRYPFALPIIEGKKLKKKCCRKYRKGKRCKRCPNC